MAKTKNNLEVETEPAKTGRPLKDVDPKQVFTLAKIGCSLREMSAVCDCSIDTLERRFAEQIEKGRESGKSKLRRKQWQAAMKGNVVMLIWLGKQMLKQADKFETSGPDGGPIKQEIDLSKLSTQDLHDLRRIYSTASQDQSASN